MIHLPIYIACAICGTLVLYAINSKKFRISTIVICILTLLGTGYILSGFLKFKTKFLDISNDKEIFFILLGLILMWLFSLFLLIKDIFSTNRMFILGKAGTGKYHLIESFERKHNLSSLSSKERYVLFHKMIDKNSNYSREDKIIAQFLLNTKQ